MNTPETPNWAGIQPISDMHTQKVTLDKLDYVVQNLIERGHEGKEFDIVSQAWRVHLRTFVLGLAGEMIEATAPATWWQHFKRDVMPTWFIQRFPVQLKTLVRERKYAAVCPHLSSNREGPHIEFFMTEDALQRTRDRYG